MKILVLPDLHLPYTDMNLIKRIANFNKKYKANEVISIGDMFDMYSLSSFVKSTKADSPSQEIEKCIPLVKEIGKLFPKITMIKGNHDLRLEKRATEAGIDSYFVKEITDAVNAPKGWKPLDQRHIIRDKVVYTHGCFSNLKKHVEHWARPVVIGHIHKKIGIEYFGRENKMIFCMCVGCCVDSEAIAFQYGPTRYNTMCMGFGTVTDGVPQIYPLSDIKVL